MMDPYIINGGNEWGVWICVLIYSMLVFGTIGNVLKEKVILIL